MKATIKSVWKTLIISAAAVGLPAFAAHIPQTVNQNAANAATAPGWGAAIWGDPADFPSAGNTYYLPSGLTLRTPNNTAPAAFPGDTLYLTNNGSFAIKHSAGPAQANIVAGPASISNSGGAGSGQIPPSPLSGTLHLIGTVNYSANAAGAPQPRHTTLQSILSGSGNFIIGNCHTSYLYLANSGTAYSGNWTNNGARIEVLGGDSPLGSGIVHLNDTTNVLSFNITNDMVINNRITGIGSFFKRGPATLRMPGTYEFTGAITNQAGTLILEGTGAQSFTQVDGSGVLRVGSSTALPPFFALKVNPNNAMTGRLELSNNVTINTWYPIEVSMRNNATPAIVNISGDNKISDVVSVQSGGGLLWIEAAAGTSLELAGGVNSAATSGRNFSLMGDGTGLVSGVISEGAASTMTVNKGGTGTWTFNAANTYIGATVISNGVLKLGPLGSIPNSSAVHLEQDGKFDVSASGFTLGAVVPQILRGKGAILGSFATVAGSSIEVGFANQIGTLTLSNNLVLGGGEIIRFEVTTDSNDVLNVSGSLTLNGSTTNLVTFPDGYVEDGIYRLINYSGTLQGLGSFVLVPPASRQSVTLNTSTPGQVNLVVTGNPLGVTWSGDGSTNAWDVGLTKNWNGNTEFFYNADLVTFNDSGSATPEIDVVSAVQVGSMLVNNTANAYTFTNFGITTTTQGTLTKRGANTLYLANDGNNFRGPISIEEGVLSIGNGATNGSLGSGNILNNGELVLNRTNGGVTLVGNITGSGSVKVTAGTFGQESGTGPTLTLQGTNTFTGPSVVEAGGSLHLRNDNALGDPSTGTLVKFGGRVGLVNLGNWVVPEPLEINGYGVSNAVGALYVNTISNNVVWTGPVTIGSPSQIRVVNNYARLTLSNNVTGDNHDLLCSASGNSASTLTFGGNVSLGPTAKLTKDENGTMWLAGNYNSWGETILSAGTLVLAGETNLWNATTINGSGTLQILTTNRPQTGDVTVNAGTLQVGNGAANGALPTGQINLVGATTAARLLVNSSNDFTLDKELIGAGNLAKLGTGTLTINRSNSFTGNVTTGSGTPTQGGKIRLENQYGLGDGLATKTVSLIRSELQLTGGLSIPALINFDISGGTFVTDVGVGLIPIHSVSGNNVVEGNITLIGGAGNGEVAADNGSLTIQGNVLLNASSRSLILSGGGTGFLNGGLNNNGANIPGLIKQGPGTWTLNNYNDYSGATVIQGGTLVLGAGGSIPNTTSIELRSNAVFNVSAVSGGFTVVYPQILRGNGGLAGNVSVFGTLSPGTGVGALTFSNSLTLAGSTIMELNRNLAPNGDLLTAAALAFGGDLTVTNIGPDLRAGDSFNLFDGPISGTFANVNLPALATPDLFWDDSLLLSQGILKVGSTQAQPPTILPPAYNGSQIVIQVDSASGFNYIVETSPAVQPAAWTGIQTNSGGGLITFTIPVNPANPQQYYRVRVE